MFGIHHLVDKQDGVGLQKRAGEGIARLCILIGYAKENVCPI